MSTTYSTRLPSITTSQLADLLRSHPASQFVGFTALTQPEGRKTPLGPLKRLVKVRAQVGAHYDRALLKATGERANEERAWGEHNDSCLVEKRDPSGRVTYYLPTQNPRYGKPLYFVEREDGRLSMVPTESAKLYLRQRPEAPVIKRDFRLDHIVSISIGGQRFRVRPEPVVG